MTASKSIQSQNTVLNPLNSDVNAVIREVEKLAVSLAHLKEKKRLLSDHGDVDMFSSLRPKLGKKFENVMLENERKSILEECRSKILPLSISELDNEIP